ncbi:ORFL261W [Human betaherpesvirus 5]|nr:ORFL261W [Human betaherpesvirus 5]QHX40644.1 ORFL261W [Human betaherpesvirus 5]
MFFLAIRDHDTAGGIDNLVAVLDEDSIVSRTVTAEKTHGKEQSVSLSAIMSGGARGSNEYCSDYTALHR